jgi:hypothetical protein
VEATCKYKPEENPQKRLISWEELFPVHDITRELEWEIQNLEKILPTSPVEIPRKRRGRIDFGRQVLKFLFGTATSSEYPK